MPLPLVVGLFFAFALFWQLLRLAPKAAADKRLKKASKEKRREDKSCSKLEQPN